MASPPAAGASGPGCNWTFNSNPMPAHETRTCPACGREFECRAGSIGQCQCSQVALTLEERAFIAERYEDCLCASCLARMGSRYQRFLERYVFHRAGR
jgi:hypothetical protein